MKVIQSPLFARKIKQLHKNQKKELDKQIRKILANIKIGEEKKGDLKNIFVYKFMLQKIRYLLAYRIKSNTLELITIGSHENYYRDLKKYLKAR
ncbi:MAG: type II toxin-antitoxin system RelE/ParE family toxin [Ignavibacteria bacterium]|nr:type II toxin-antitoxin system RelE/ParE family toxin [Ignavibacteria bacterium]